MSAEEAGEAGVPLAGAQPSGEQTLPQEPPREILGSRPLKDTSSQLPLPSPLPHSPGVCQRSATVTMVTLAPARSSAIRRSQGRGRAAALISPPIELGSFKIRLWLRAAD